MSEPFLSEIKIMSFNFPPRNWAFCDGQLLPINQNQALFSLLGTNYGGNGQTNFALPDFRGRVPIHVGNGHTLGERAGTEAETISIQQMPTHIHLINSTNDAVGTSPTPTNNLLANGGSDAYTIPANLVAMNVAAVSNAGGSQAHENRQPYLALRFCIALTGIFPSQN